jgi:nuclear mRNA export protein SAC3
MEFYSEMATNGRTMPNEAEFQAYYILTLPWSNEVPSKLEKELSPNILFDPLVQLAMKIRFLMSRRFDRNRPNIDGSLNHFCRIFSLIRADSTPYLFACCIHIHFVDIRTAGIRAIQKSYHYVENDPNSGLPLSDIIEMLGFEGEKDSIKFLKHYFIEVGHGKDGKVAYVGRKVVRDMAGNLKGGDYPKFPCIYVLT